MNENNNLNTQQPLNNQPVNMQPQQPMPGQMPNPNINQPVAAMPTTVTPNVQPTTINQPIANPGAQQTVIDPNAVTMQTQAAINSTPTVPQAVTPNATVIPEQSTAMNQNIMMQNTQPMAMNPNTMVQNTQPMAMDPNAMVQNTQPMVIDPNAMVQNTQPMAMDPNAMVQNSQPMVMDPNAMIQNTQPMVVDPNAMIQNTQPMAMTPNATTQAVQPTVIDPADVSAVVHPVVVDPATVSAVVNAHPPTVEQVPNQNVSQPTNVQQPINPPPMNNQPAPVPETVQLQQKKKNSALIVIILIMGIIIIGLAGYLLYSNMDNGEPVNNGTEIQDENVIGAGEVDDPTTSIIQSGDWTSGEFTLAGVNYKLNNDYFEFVRNGWSVDFVKLGYGNGYILNKGDKTFSTTNLENQSYSDANVNIGFINLGEESKDASECQYWSISIDNAYTDTPVDFELPGGLRNGSTLAEVEAAYGKPTDENIYRSEDLKYTVYKYQYEYSVYLDVTVYDEGGLTGFDYKIY